MIGQALIKSCRFNCFFPASDYWQG